MGEDDVVTTSGEPGGTDITTPDTSQTTVEANTAKTIVIAIVLATLLVVGLLGVTGWATIQRGWSLGQPWWYGLQLRYVATPIAALTAAIVAITTAWWTVRSTRAISAAEHTRWETDRKNENTRRATDRQDAIERTLRDRFHELVKLLASDELRAREGAAYAVAALADDWSMHYRNEPNRARAEQQVCIDVLISQLRDPMPDDELAPAHMVAFKHSIQGIFRSRLGTVEEGIIQPGVWTSFNLVFDGCTFHEFDVIGCVFSGDTSFDGARFARGARFNGAQFSGDTSFDGAQFSGDTSFNGARFARGARFDGARFVRGARFDGAQFSGDTSFGGAQFSGFAHFSARFARGANFNGAHFTGKASFQHACFVRDSFFDGAHFTGDAVFYKAHFGGGLAYFHSAHFVRGVEFNGAQFTATAWFRNAHFAITRVSFDKARFKARAVVDDNTYFSVPPAEFPKCEVCDEIRAMQETAREPDNGSP